jgi:DNA-binding GntR family transcriptional regulator
MAGPASGARSRTLPPSADASGRRSSGSQAAEYIRRLIFDGDLRPGERIPQDSIAEVLSLSRIPVREGLIALEREGWVRIELNRGAFVNALDADAVRDSYELYGLIYGFAIRRAVARSDETLFGTLREIEREMRSTDDPDRFWTMTLAFHNAIVEASRSPRIKVMLRASTGLVSGNFFEKIPGSIEIERRGTTAIIKALRKDDIDRAANAYADMMHRQGEQVVETFQSRGLFDSP